MSTKADTPTKKPKRFCHDCQHLSTTGGYPKCSMHFKTKYFFPSSSLDQNYGRASVFGCGKAFTQRTSDYYEGRKNLWTKPKEEKKTKRTKANK